jgi:hypothetical protein
MKRLFIRLLAEWRLTRAHPAHQRDCYMGITHTT